MHEARVGADDLAEMGEERDDVVLGGRLDLVDAGDVEGRCCPCPRSLCAASRDDAEIGQCVVACASISNQMR